uniref:F5/8 type C domain-containing protein n=1 Tax=Rodentolepis nana TaxID=102285 RepID=A0A0R3TBL4_RODNA
LISLNPPIIARWVRIYPYTQKPMYVCAKFQFYGCRFSDELVEYKIPGGSDFTSTSYGSAPINLRDTCYEGQSDPRGGILHNGLGCLSDSRVSTSTKAFDLSPWQHDSERSGAATVTDGDCLVGWNRSRWEEARRSPSPVVDLVYRFSGLRTFQALHLYALNLPAKKQVDSTVLAQLSHLLKSVFHGESLIQMSILLILQIRIPRRIELSFSIDGTTFPSTPDIASDVHSYTADPLIIDLNAKSGRSVQLKLFFADEWIILSETRFISVAGKETDLGGKVEKEGSTGISAHGNVNPPSSIPPAEKNDPVNNYNPNLEPEEVVEPDDPIHNPNIGALRPIEPPPYQGPTMLVLILVFLCCFMLLLVGVACFSISWMKNRKKKRQQAMRGDIQSPNGKLFKSH